MGAGRIFGIMAVVAMFCVGCGGGGGGYQNKVTITTFVDSRDNKTYKKVTIGDRVWMAENLNSEVAGGQCYYANDPSNCAKYGRLYTWDEATAACPAGWHLPSDYEWMKLEKEVGGSSTAGTKLKSTSGWNDNGNGTDEHGFSALPGSSGSGGSPGNTGFWWTATEGLASSAYCWGMNKRYKNTDGGLCNKADRFSVRCVAD